jgi:hypothetical protein
MSAGIWEGSENGGSTNPPSPLVDLGTAADFRAVDHDSALFVSAFESPNKLKIDDLLVRAHSEALTNGIWEAADDDFPSRNDSPLTVGSSSSAKKPMFIDDKENVPVHPIVNTQVIQSGYLERLIKNDEEYIWINSNYQLIDSYLSESAGSGHVFDISNAAVKSMKSYNGRSNIVELRYESSR